MEILCAGALLTQFAFQMFRFTPDARRSTDKLQRSTLSRANLRFAPETRRNNCEATFRNRKICKSTHRVNLIIPAKNGTGV